MRYVGVPAGKMGQNGKKKLEKKKKKRGTSNFPDVGGQYYEASGGGLF